MQEERKTLKKKHPFSFLSFSPVVKLDWRMRVEQQSFPLNLSTSQHTKSIIYCGTHHKNQQTNQ